jgi:hypothetical protein
MLPVQSAEKGWSRRNDAPEYQGHPALIWKNRSEAMIKQPEIQQTDIDEYRHIIAEWEHEVQATYSELGFVGEKRGDQVFMEEVARGELSRGLREMAHGEFGPKAYEWLRQIAEARK